MGALENGRFAEEMMLELTDFCGSGSGPEPQPASTHNHKSIIERSVRVLLQGLGEDGEREGIRRTPLRVAKAFAQGTRGCFLGQLLKEGETTFKSCFWL